MDAEAVYGTKTHRWWRIRIRGLLSEPRSRLARALQPESEAEEVTDHGW